MCGTGKTQSWNEPKVLGSGVESEEERRIRLELANY